MSDEPNDIDSTLINRKIAKRMASDAASRGDGIAGSLADLENAAAIFYLGTDADTNDEDLGVWP